jgi:Domain of unknown function (DUF4160)
MPCVHTLSNSKVYVHARGEHPPPHFHLVGPDWDASIDIRTLELTKGWAPSSDLAEAKTWAKNHQDYLLVKWSEYNERDN